MSRNLPNGDFAKAEKKYSLRCEKDVKDKEFVWMTINGGKPFKCYPCTQEDLFGKQEDFNFECPICGRKVKGVYCCHKD